jgi:DedD protein
MQLIKQQRLIGIILLLLLISVLAYWLIINASPEDEQKNLSSSNQSPFNSLVEPISQDIEVLDYDTETKVDPHQPDTHETEEVLVAEPAVEDTAPAPAPAPAEVTNQSEKWVIQLGSFSQKKYAEALVVKVKQLGYKPIVETANKSGKTIYRVRVINYTSKSAAQKIASDIQQKLKISPQVF